MQCPQCQHKNSGAAKFCEECGTRLAQACPACGQEVNPRAKFCPNCGVALKGKESAKRGPSEAATEGEAAKRGTGKGEKSGTAVVSLQTSIASFQHLTPSPQPLAGERRQLTVIFILGMGTLMRGWALSERRQAKEGIAQLRQGIAAWRATGAELNCTEFLALLAGAYAKVGQTEEGLTVLAEALDLIEKTGERYHEAELYRLEGELLLAQAEKLRD